ncbi:MAG TPA: tetratricopeptide repeat protein [Pirellulaceae bacterium]|nr:tetratricopeptide repeat protein [Pirellulaceae bacterium]
MRSTWWQLAGVGLVVVLAGCSQLPGRTNLGLPSPQATIAAAEKQKTTDRTKPLRIVSKGFKQTVSRVDPAVEDVIIRGRSLEQAGQFDKARKTYETALADHPGCAPLLHRLGIVSDCQKRHADAEQLFRSALEASPQNADVLGDLGYCYFLQGRLDEASDSLTEAVALDPKNPRHRNNLGLVLGHQQDYDAAYAQFAAAGSEADAYYNMAFIFAAQDLTDEAKGCFQEAVAADPSHERARVALASFEEYDSTPAREDGDAELTHGVRYVPYVEDLESGPGDAPVQPASATTNLPASRDVGRTTRTLQLRSRGLLSRHMQQQRGAGFQSALNGQAESQAHD